MTIIVPKTVTQAGITSAPEIQETMLHHQGTMLIVNTHIPVPVKNMEDQCHGHTVTVMDMGVAESLGATWNVPVPLPIGTHMTATVTRAAPHLQGALHHPTVEVAEAVAMTIMAAVPEMDMEVATVTPAAEATLTQPAVASVLAGRRGGQPHHSREATLLEILTAAPAVAHLGVPEEEVDPIGALAEADTKMDHKKKSLNHTKCVFSSKTNKVKNKWRLNF